MQSFWAAVVGGGFGGTLAGLSTLVALAIWVRISAPQPPAEADGFEFLSVAVTGISAAIGALIGAVSSVLFVWFWTGTLPPLGKRGPAPSS
jgi:hypothetical protein